VLPRIGSSFVTRWMAVTLVASLVAILDGGWLAHWASLVPARVAHGEVWRLVTWPLVQLAPIGLVLTCLSIYKFGGELAVVWGDRRLQRFAVQLVLAAGASACVLAGVAGASYLDRLGGWAIIDVLVIAWARQFPTRTLVLYGLVGLRGRDLVRVTCAISGVFAIYFGPVTMAPELAACALAAWYPAAWLRR
jgi:membrane associated rhomboid family serine protease